MNKIRAILIAQICGPQDESYDDDAVKAAHHSKWQSPILQLVAIPNAFSLNFVLKNYDNIFEIELLHNKTPSIIYNDGLYYITLAWKRFYSDTNYFSVVEKFEENKWQRI